MLGGSILAVLFQVVSPSPAGLCLERPEPVFRGRGEVVDRPTVAPLKSGFVIFWEQSPGRNEAGNPTPPFGIVRARLDSALSVVEEAEPFSRRWDNEWSPSVAVAAGQAWLTSYFAHRDRRTGDRDIQLQRLDQDAKGVLERRLITRDRLGSRYPVNDASPSLLVEAASSRMLIAWSSGAYRADHPPDDVYLGKNILLAELDSSSRVRRQITLTTSAHRGRAMTPSLARRNDTGSHVLAWVSDSAGVGKGRYDLYLAEFDGTWQRRTIQRVTRSTSGVVSPSLTQIGEHLLLAWHDLGTGDVVLAEVGRDLRTILLGSLRQALIETLGEGNPDGFPIRGRVSAPALFEAGENGEGPAGLAFVVTTGDPDRGQLRQELWITRLLLRGQTCERKG